jgi:hypothetical protein
MINFFPELKKPKSDGLASALGLEDFRNPYEIYFGLFGEDDSGGGSDNVDRSNPNEMRAREQAAARAGTVTSTNADGTRSAVTSGGGTGVVTAGTQGQQVAAREAFNAATGNERSNFAQDQYDQVKAREDAALQRAAAAGRLAGSDRGADVSAINQALGRSDPNEIFDFDITQDRNVSMDDITSPVGITAAESLRQATARMMGDDPNAPAALTVAQRAALTPAQKFALSERTNKAALSNLTPEEQAEREAIAAKNQARVFETGIMTTPQATAANVLGIDRSNPREMAARESNMARMATADAGMITDASPRSNQVVLGGGFDDMSKVNDLMPNQRGITAPAGTVRDLQRARTTAPVPGGITTIQGPTAQDLANVQLPSMADAETRDPFAPSGYDARGLPTGLQTFTNNQGITATTNLAGLTQAQRDNLPGYMNPEEGGLQDTIFGNPLDTAYGYELDAQGNVTGIVGQPGGGGMVGAGMELLTNALLGPPESVEDLLNRSVYTGYGPGSQVGMDGSDDGGEVKSPTDPCPEGFVLKDGVCTPVDQAGDDAGSPGSDFVFQPPTAPPTFQPITQGTPINQINPFVLQPYPRPPAVPIPFGINPPGAAAASGIQPMSPTGAALGRQI